MQQDQIEAFRQIYWNLPDHVGEVFLYSLILITTVVMTWGILRDIALWRKGRPEARISQIPGRIREFLAQVFGQKKVLRDRRPGAMHALIFFGFLTLFIGTDIIAVEEDFTIPFMGEAAGTILVGNFYKSFEFILDTLGLVFVIGLIWAAVRRYNNKPDRLDNRFSDAWVLGVLLFLGIGGFIIEGLRIANQTIGYIPVYTQDWAKLSYVGYGLAMFFRAIGLGDGSPVGLGLHLFFWFTHAAATAAFIATLPFTKFKHIFYTPINTFFRDTTPNGALDPIPDLDAEIEKDEPRLGVATLADLSWKRRLDMDACMRCGRCQANCPAHASGSDLSPKFLITKMHDLMHQKGVVFRDGTVKAISEMEAGEGHGHSNGGGDGNGKKGAVDVETLPLYGNLFSENELWSCTTCYACVNECPAMIEHVDDIIDVRRHLTMIASEVPAGVKSVLEGIERAGNPWRLPARDRTAWADGLDVPTMAEKEEAEVLYWVGCAPSYDDRSKRVARALVQLLQAANVDFAILGDEETCNGDPARRMGEEMLYQAQVQQNIETMKQYKFKKIITTCPHCFNTIKNEYPQFGGGAGTEYEVIHHTEYIAELIAAGKLKPQKPVNERVVYHDPCYIGRYNDIYDAPRQVLASIPGVELVEAPDRNREKAMCCGGGGGNVWLEGWGKKDVNVIRLEQLTQEKPETLAMSCPFCMVMFEDAAKNTGQDETLARKDIAELVLESLEPKPSA